MSRDGRLSTLDFHRATKLLESSAYGTCTFEGGNVSRRLSFVLDHSENLTGGENIPRLVPVRFLRQTKFGEPQSDCLHGCRFGRAVNHRFQKSPLSGMTAKGSELTSLDSITAAVAMSASE